MATRTQTPAATGRDHTDHGEGKRNIAQTVCLLLGGALVLAGIVGFFVNSDFSTGDNPPGDLLLGLEVNGWHNVAHILTGGLLLLGVPKARMAVTVLYAFAAGYILVAAWGFIAETNVVQALAINDADNVFHLALILISLGAAFVGSKGIQEDRARNGRTA